MIQIPGYQIERPLGRGATAQVYSAVQLEDQCRVALKVFHPGLWDQADLRRRAINEFETSFFLKHPNIIQILGANWELDPPIVVLEYAEGGSLEEFQSRLPYVLPEIGVLILIEVLSALEFAHKNGVIHRDLKPANILIRLGQNAGILVSDFGLAKLRDVTQYTLSGTVLGSPDYMSPEQARGDVIEPRSDLFSAAAILYFLVTGTRPFSRHTPLATLAAVIEGQFEPPQRRNPKLGPELAALIQKGLLRELLGRSLENLNKRIREQFFLMKLGNFHWNFKQSCFGFYRKNKSIRLAQFVP